MAMISCPKCEKLTGRGGFAVWQILVSIVLFPIGLLALCFGRKPAQCRSCGMRFIA